MGEGKGEMKKRLALFAMEHLGIPVHRFERNCGLSSSYCNNGNSVGSYAQKRIAEAYPELNINWVLTGEGGMLVGKKSLAKEGKASRHDISAYKKEIELYRSLYEKGIAQIRELSEQIGALKAEVGRLKNREGQDQAPIK